MEAFEDIPDIIEMARNKRRIFQSNQTLKDRTINLYTTLLHAITNLIASLLEKGYGGSQVQTCMVILTCLKGNRIIAAFKGPLAGKPIDEILERVKRSAKALQSCVENIRDEKLTDIHKATAQTNVGMQAVRLNTKNTEIGVRGISTELVKVGGTMQSMSGQLKSLEDQMQEIHQMQEQMLMREKAEANGIDAQNGLFRFLCERVRGKHPLRLRQQIKSAHFLKVLESEKKELEIERSRTPIPYPASFLPLDQLLSALEVPYMEASNDLDYMLRQGKNFDIVAQGQARWLLQIKQFQGWLLSKDSDLLLVDGNADFDSSGPGRISPMSFLCATLVLSLLNNRPRPVSLHFFCGLHVASDDSLRGPNGLVRSLITQLLLTQREFSLNFINSHAYRKDLESQTLVALCHTFQQLVKQLPLDTLVLCVIDGISLYERAEWQGDLAFVVDRLNEIVKDECLQPTFKLLMASPYTSRYTQRQVAPCQHVVLQAGNANGLSISQRSLGMSVSQPQTLSGNPIRRPVPPRVELNDGEDDESSDEEYNLRFGV